MAFEGSYLLELLQDLNLSIAQRNDFKNSKWVGTRTLPKSQKGENGFLLFYKNFTKKLHLTVASHTT
jgi:hypothetical protein